MPLPVLPPEPPQASDTDAACSTCSRRELLRGLGAAVATSLALSACGGGGGATTADAPPPDSPGGSCPTNELCLDTTKPAYSTLANVDGSVVVSTQSDTIIVVRTSATTVAALSAICTHQGCTVGYRASLKLLLCPCHGAEFSMTGQVVRGPAAVPVKAYQASVSGTLVTVVLA